MTSKLCILLLGLAALAAFIQADFSPKRKLVKRQDISREELVHYLKNLTEDDVEQLTDEEKLDLVFLIFLHGIEQSELEKRSLLGLQKRSAFPKFAKRSLNKREIDSNDDDDLSREEFIAFLKNLTPEDVEKLTDEQKLGLVFLIYLFEVEPHELEKRDALKVFAAHALKKRQAEDAENAEDAEDADDADDEDGELTRESFVAYLQSLSDEDVEQMSNEQKLGVLLLINLYDVQREEIE